MIQHHDSAQTLCYVPCPIFAFLNSVLSLKVQTVPQAEIEIIFYILCWHRWNLSHRTCCTSVKPPTQADYTVQRQRIWMFLLLMSLVCHLLDWSWSALKIKFNEMTFIEKTAEKSTAVIVNLSKQMFVCLIFWHDSHRLPAKTRSVQTEHHKKC